MPGMRRPAEVPCDLVRYLDEIRPGYAASLERRGRIVIVEHQPIKAKA